MYAVISNINMEYMDDVRFIGAAAVVLGCVADRITNITQNCMHHYINNTMNLWV